MSHHHRKPNRSGNIIARSLAAKFVLAVLATTVILQALSGYFLIINQSHTLTQQFIEMNKQTEELLRAQASETLQQKMDGYKNLLSSIAPNAMMEMDLTALNQYATVVTADPGIDYVAFLNPEGKLFAENGQWDRSNQDTLIQSEIKAEGVDIGKVLIVYNLEQMQEYLQKVAAHTAQSEEINESIHNSFVAQALLAVVITSTVIALVIYFLFKSIVLNRISKLECRLKDIDEGGGDLTKRLDVMGSDELAGLAYRFNNFTGKIESIVQQVNDVAEFISGSALRISQGNQDLTRKTEHQEISLKRTTEKMREMADTVTQNARNSTTANQLAQQARKDAESGSGMISRVADAMNDINNSSQEILSINSLVNEIAFQTNLLALNAAVEAARAGDHGKGFAVVAAEVRNLAQRSANAAKEIQELIDNTAHRVKVGAQLVDDSKTSLQRIENSVLRVSDLICDITNSNHEQAHDIEQVNNVTHQIDMISVENLKLVKNVTNESHSMKAEVSQLVHLVGSFKVHEKGPLAEAPRAGLSLAD